MRRIKKQFASRKSDQAAVSSIFAILLGTGALLGMMALSFDTGTLYLEQQTLREASSSAARALAEKCAYAAPQCASQSAATAMVQTILNSNSRDSMTAIEEVCGSAPLNSCLPLSTRSMDCKTPPSATGYARVTSKTRTSTGNTIDGKFAGLLDGNGANTLHSQLWNCAQAIWQVSGGSGPSTGQTLLNVAFPACDYPGNSNPVVLFAFRNSSPNPTPPRTISCMVTSGGNSATLNNVGNGFFPFIASVGSCDTYVTYSIGQEMLFNNLQSNKYCGGSPTSFETFLDARIAAGTTLDILLEGAVSGSQPNSWQIAVLGFSTFKFLGYHLSTSKEGGTTPPGGWANYPPGVPNGERCTASRDCFYGQYMSAPSFLTASTVVVKLVP